MLLILISHALKHAKKFPCKKFPMQKSCIFTINRCILIVTIHKENNFIGEILQVIIATWIR